MCLSILNFFKKQTADNTGTPTDTEPVDEEYSEPEGELICLSRKDTVFVAHKGLVNRKNPANSKTAFFRAGKLALSGIECDLWESAHGRRDTFRLVLAKEQNLMEICGVDKDITELTPAEIDKLPPLITKDDTASKQGLCTLRKFLVVCSLYNIVPFINLRMGEYSIRAIREIFKELNITGTLNRTVFVSSKPRVLFAIRKYARRRNLTGPKYMLTVNEGINERMGENIIDQAIYVKEHKFDGIRINRKVMSDEVYKYCVENDLLIDVWLYKKNDQENLKADLENYPAIYSAELHVRL